jgi:hypothetical protein
VLGHLRLVWVWCPQFTTDGWPVHLIEITAQTTLTGNKANYNSHNVLHRITQILISVNSMKSNPNTKAATWLAETELVKMFVTLK